MEHANNHYINLGICKYGIKEFAYKRLTCGELAVKIPVTCKEDKKTNILNFISQLK